MFPSVALGTQQIAYCYYSDQISSTVLKGTFLRGLSIRYNRRLLCRPNVTNNSQKILSPSYFRSVA